MANHRKRVIRLSWERHEAIVLARACNTVTRQMAGGTAEFYALADLARWIEEYFELTPQELKDPFTAPEATTNVG